MTEWRGILFSQGAVHDHVSNLNDCYAIQIDNNVWKNYIVVWLFPLGFLGRKYKQYKQPRTLVHNLEQSMQSLSVDWAFSMW